MRNTLTTFKGIKKGQKFRIIANTSGHRYPLNETLTFAKAGVTTAAHMASPDGTNRGSVYSYEIELVASDLKSMSPVFAVWHLVICAS